MGDAWAVMRWFAAGWVLEEGASKASSDVTAPQKRREELSKLIPAGPFFFGLTMAHANHRLTAVLAVQLP